MNVCIVGHGPSLMGAGKGELIDSHDVVVRLKNCGKSLESPWDYGRRADVLCASTEVTGLFDKVMAGMYWAYPKNGDYDKVLVSKNISELGAPVMIPLKLCNHWNEEFRKLNPNFPNVSTGMAAIIIAAHYYEPKEIVLGGFDCVLNPSLPFERNDVIPRTGVGKIPHDWVAENKLLKIIGNDYNVKIGRIE